MLWICTSGPPEVTKMANVLLQAHIFFYIHWKNVEALPTDKDMDVCNHMQKQSKRQYELNARRIVIVADWGALGASHLTCRNQI